MLFLIKKEKKTMVGGGGRSSPLMIFKPFPHLQAGLERITLCIFRLKVNEVTILYCVREGGVMIHRFADCVFATPEGPVLFETMVKHALYQINLGVWWLLLRVFLTPKGEILHGMNSKAFGFHIYVDISLCQP